MRKSIHQIHRSADRLADLLDDLVGDLRTFSNSDALGSSRAVKEALTIGLAATEEKHGHNSPEADDVRGALANMK